MKYFLILIMAINYTFSQSKVEIKILDTLIYKDKPFNVSITNNSTHTYLFFIDKTYKGATYLDLPWQVSNVLYPQIVLIDEENIELKSIILVTSSHEVKRENIVDKVIFKEQFKIGGKGVIILKPNESFNFMMVLNLTPSEETPYYPVNLEKNYKLFLKFKPCLINFKEYIPEETLVFIEKYNIVVFNNELVSNIVDIILNTH